LLRTTADWFKKGRCLNARNHSDRYNAPEFDPPVDATLLPHSLDIESIGYQFDFGCNQTVGKFEHLSPSRLPVLAGDGQRFLDTLPRVAQGKKFDSLIACLQWFALPRQGYWASESTVAVAW
jgi:hypothetical protein